VLVFVLADEVDEDRSASQEELNDTAEQLREQIKKRKSLDLAEDVQSADITF
jgi:hypothetical protein